MDVDAKTICYGLLGNPVRHSLSPAMHNAAFKALGLNGVYLCFEPEDAQLKNALLAIKALGFGGFNVTVPYKEKVMRYLDEATLISEKIGAVNTVYIRDGKIIGTNTDAEGFFRDLRDSLRFVPKNKFVFVLGAGGAAKAVVFAIAGGGAKALYIVDKDIKKSRSLAKRVNKYYPEVQAVALKSVDDIYLRAKGISLIVNATPVGMRPGKPILDLRHFSRNAVVYDVVYNRQTELVSQAKKLKMKAAIGLGMLLMQGALAFQLWTGKKPPVDVMSRALKKAMNGRKGNKKQSGEK